MSCLSISSKKISKCSDVVDHLQSVGITCKINDNTSIVYNKGTNKYEQEHGCDILITDPIITQKKIEQVWFPLREKYNLDCAYLNLIGNYHGCVWDYLRSSKCPQGPHGLL
jgi:hypothetical protein